MTDSRGKSDAFNQGNCSESYGDYLERAAAACEAGDLVLGMHLYLAAYERAVVDPDIADGTALLGLQEAWNLACDLKERSMAEYVFEKLEPFLTGEEIAECANKLQDLALDRLEEYGFSREELEDMAEMISQDLIDGEGSIVKVESISVPHVSALGAMIEAETAADDFDDLEAFEVPDAPDGVSELSAASEGVDSGASSPAQRDFESPLAPSKPERPSQSSLGVAIPDVNPYELHNTSSVGKSYHAATNDGTGAYVFTRDEARAAESKQVAAQKVEKAAEADVGSEGGAAEGGSRNRLGEREPKRAPGALQAPGGAIRQAAGAPAAAPAGTPQRNVKQQAVAPAGTSLSTGEVKVEMPSMPEVPAVGSGAFNYQSLAGYDEVVSLMRDMGVGLQREAGFRNFVNMMNSRHGVSCMPALDTLLFRAPVIEDATRFVDATIGELGLPVLRMSMEEGFQGNPMLCVTTLGDSRPRMNHARNRFEGPGILVMDDLDMWTMPQLPDGVEGIAGFMMANMSRGAREAVNLIRSAVEDPDVFVFATATIDGEVESFFYDLLEPITIIDIASPTDSERGQIWAEIMREHPSMRELDRAALVRLSAGLPRYDIFMAARAAVEEAYKFGLSQRKYVPVTPQNIFDKLAVCHPLDSDEYRAIEEEVVRDFRNDLEHLEDLMSGAAE